MNTSSRCRKHLPGSAAFMCEALALHHGPRPSKASDSGRFGGQPKLTQFLHAGASALPLSPLAAAELAQHPGIEFLEDDLHSAQAIVGCLAPQHGVEIFFG